MPDPNPLVLDFLLTRRSRPGKLLAAPFPTPQDLTPILTAAARTPDHGALEPWRFIVLTGAALPRIAGVIEARGPDLGKTPEDIDKLAAVYRSAGCVVAVIASPKPSPKIPEIEQTYSAGAVCLALVNAGLAAGWGANWLSGWISHDAEFRTRALNLATHERIAGFIHLGTEPAAPPERPRPDLSTITSWVSA